MILRFASWFACINNILYTATFDLLPSYQYPILSKSNDFSNSLHLVDLSFCQGVLVFDNNHHGTNYLFGVGSGCKVW